MAFSPSRIGIVGAGSWGTALALHLSRNNRPVDLWVYEPELCRELETSRENKTFLPGFRIPGSVRPFNDLPRVVQDKDILFLVTPSHVMRQIARNLRPHLSPGTLVVNASKGLEESTLLTLSGVLREEWGDQVSLAGISGPTFAVEVARGLPTTLVAASPDPSVTARVQEILASSCLRVFHSTDLLGVELGGALKNVIAIAAGICDGLELGHNARAGLITRGLVEITRIGTALGARPETFSGLSGLGDLVLTCTGNLSRNRRVGLALAQGQTLQEITRTMTMVAEGIRTVVSARALKQKHGIQAAIIEETYQVLHQGKPARQALEDLMRVETSHEFSGVKGLE